LNRIPFPVDDTAYTKENVPVNGNVLLNDDPGDTPISSLTIVTNGSHGMAVLNPDGTFTYTPDLGFYGTDSFVYQLCDANNDCAQATVAITVNSVPTANNDNVTVNEDALLIGTVATNDIPSADGGNVWSLATPPTNGVVAFNPDGTYTYQPNTNYKGSDAFSYTLCDVDGDCSGATVSITVTPVNDAPVAFDQNLTTPEDTRTNSILTGFDPDGDPFVFTIVSAPTNGLLFVNTNTGAFSYTPHTNFSGLDAFTFRSKDATMSSATTRPWPTIKTSRRRKTRPKPSRSRAATWMATH
jgi:VCBS repeat-containing protein